jgi:hypothetical protein
MTTYRIVRFHRTRDREVVMTGLTLEEAQEHCNDPDTSGDDWFDGFFEEER